MARLLERDRLPGLHQSNLDARRAQPGARPPRLFFAQSLEKEALMNAREAPRRARGAGFSLIELMVVIAIIGLLATIVSMNLTRTRERANATKVVADVKSLDHAVVLFQMDLGRWPASLDELVTPGGSDWRGPYIEGG